MFLEGKENSGRAEGRKWEINGDSVYLLLYLFPLLVSPGP